MPGNAGIVHAVSGFLLEHGCDIIDNKQFDSQLDHHFFMRIHFASDGDQSTIDSLRDAFAPVAEKFGMRWQLQRHGAKRRVLIMVSRFDHCLNDLLFRARIGELPIDIVGVVSNHPDPGARRMARIPFFHVPVTQDTKAAAEARLLSSIARTSNWWSWPATCRSSATTLPEADRPGDQHPSLVPPELQRRQAVPPGLRAGREDRGCHRALRQR